MDDPAFASSTEADDPTQAILLAASQHNIPSLKPLLRTQGNASLQDPETGFTPLHAAIAACEDDPNIDIEKAKATVNELFMSGAIWNDLDVKGETPGCLAWRIGRMELYELVVEAGVRAEMLLGLLGGGGYEELDSGDEEEGTLAEEPQNGETNGNTNGDSAMEGVLQIEKRDVNSEDYLKSELTFADDKLLDADANGVMMAWETDIMRRSVDTLIPSLTPGARILNIGFGMGIIDRMFRDTKPLSHHIIEAHPAVLAKLSSASSEFGASWEASAPSGGSYKIHAGKWQDVVGKLLEEGEVFDAIYFDTFGEDYSQLKLFFSEYVVGLLDPEGRFGFFNGLGADRRVCYDVYRRVTELDLCDAGMDVDWIDVPVENLGDDGEGEWENVRRRYWTLDNYRLPVCTFLG